MHANQTRQRKGGQPAMQSDIKKYQSILAVRARNEIIKMMSLNGFNVRWTTVVVASTWCGLNRSWKSNAVFDSHTLCPIQDIPC